MKRTIKNLFFSIIFIFILSSTVQAMNINVETTPKEVKVGDEITVKVTLDEPVVTSDFKLKYNKDNFQFVKANTEYLNVKDYTNDGYVNSVYANIEGKTANEFEFTFKAIKQIENAEFEIGEINCTTGENKTYDDSNLDQDYKSDKVTITANSGDSTNNGEDKTSSSTNGKTGDSTQANKILPFAGTNAIIIISIIVLIALAIIFKKKVNWLTKILPVFIVGIVVANMNNSYAYNQAIKVYKLKVDQTENVYAILLNSVDTEKKITVSELKEVLKSTTEIKSKDNQTLQDSQLVGTGSTITLSDSTEYKVLLYGDCNGDGKVNSNDTYMIIQHMLGNKQLTGLYAKAANLSNKNDQDDKTIDKEDVARHVDFLLGTLEDNSVEELPEGAKEDENGEVKEITAQMVAEHPDMYYGLKVTNYESTNGQNDWRIFYSDGEHIFLITGGYVDLSSENRLDSETRLTRLDVSSIDQSTKYRASWNARYLPGELQKSENNSIVESRFKATGYKLNENHTNSLCVSTLLNADNWKNYKDSEGKAEYAIGGSTIEMWMDSWNKRYPSDSDQLNWGIYTDRGYGVWCEGQGSSTVIDGDAMREKEGYNNPLYYPYKNTVKDGNEWCASYWIASPSAIATKPNETTADFILGVNYTGGISNYSYDDANTGLRPVVSLNSGIKVNATNVE